MDTHPIKITKLLGEVADEIRQNALEQVEIWQQIPYAAARAADTCTSYTNGIPSESLAYKNGLWDISSWNDPIGLFVELSTGQLLVQVSSRLKPVSNDQLLKGYVNYHSGLKNARAVLNCLRKRDPFDMPTHTRQEIKQRKDALAKADELCKHYGVTEKWTKPATPVIYPVYDRT